jgi:hypothetical protein
MALTWMYRGFAYTSYYNGAYENDDSLNALTATGANAVETTLDWGIDPLNNTVYADSNYTDPLSAEASMIQQAVADGLQVMVKPHLDFLNPAYLTGTPYSVGDWRTYYNPGAAGSAGANSFFASYKTMLLQEAAVASANGATLFCIGTELDQITGPAYKSYWDDIISTLRADDPKLKLTYAADWNDASSPWQWGGSGLPVGTGNIATQVSFASELDYLGLDVYAPLSDATDPSLQQLIDGWTQTPVNSGATAETYDVTGDQSLIQYFESVAAAVGKPLLFTEIGYENASDAASSPAGSATNAEDDALQARLYQAFFEALGEANDSSLDGAFLYNWDPNASEVGAGSVNFSPQGLPALSVVASNFAAPSLSAPSTLSAPLEVAKSVAGVALGANSTGDVFTVTLTASKGLLNVSGGSGTATLTLSGSLAAVNAALATLQYEETSAAADTIHIAASADGGPTANTSIAVANDPAPPTPGFVNATPVSGATINLSGAVSPADAGDTARYFIDGVAGPTALVGADGSFAANLTLPTGEIDVVSASVTDAGGNAGSTPPLMIGVSDGLTAAFSQTDGYTVNVFNAATLGDTVNGADGYVILHASRATIDGGDDQIYADASPLDAATLTGTGGVSDLFVGSGDTVTLKNAQVRMRGTGDSVVVASGGSNLVTGAGNLQITEDAGANVRLGGTATYQATATQARVALAPNIQAQVSGVGDTFVLNPGAQLALLSGQQDVVAAGLNAHIADGGSGTIIRIAQAVGALQITGFGADATGIVSLLNGVGGYTSKAEAAAALHSDGAGGSLLSLGADGTIDFVGVAPTAIGAGRFRIV